MTYQVVVTSRVKKQQSWCEAALWSCSLKYPGRRERFCLDPRRRYHLGAFWPPDILFPRQQKTKAFGLLTHCDAARFQHEVLVLVGRHLVTSVHCKSAEDQMTTHSCYSSSREPPNSTIFGWDWTARVDLSLVGFWTSSSWALFGQSWPRSLDEKCVTSHVLHAAQTSCVIANAGTI